MSLIHLLNNFLFSVKARITVLLLLVICAFLSCDQQQKNTEFTVVSPDKANQIVFKLSNKGKPVYLVKHHNKTVIDSSSVSFDIKGQAPMANGFEIVKADTLSKNETWEMPWGEQRKVINNYSELLVELQEKNAPNRKLNIYFRCYNDGIGFRYEFPTQKGMDSIAITEENTNFKLIENTKTWWLPGDWDSYEHLYHTTNFSDIDVIAYAKSLGKDYTSIKDNAVNTPITMKMEDGVHLSFHEAGLLDYAGMTLKIDNADLKMTSQLVGSDRYDYKVKRALPFKTPWRTIQIADKATELIDSKLIVNLNEPNKLKDISWFKPQKYMGIWWEMHINKGTWDYGLTLDKKTGKWIDTGNAHGRHSATTQNAKRYIDFAAANGIKGLLIEGWNTGWEKWIGFEDREDIFDYVTSYPDYDLKEVVQYAKDKGVEIIMHHETSSAINTYEKHIDSAYNLMSSLGIHAVKSGYVGKIIPKGEYHHGQWMVNHYQSALEKAAAQNIAINAHEPIKATGLRRTYPNMVTREGLRGQEYNAWYHDGGNPPEHLPIIAFTRMLAGPIDFTPGVFDITIPTKKDNQVNTTLAQQLALYVVIYSPMQMACDLPENYENQPAFQFIKDVGVDWEQTVVLNGEVGDFVTIARQERETGNWFVGGITDENAREITLNFDFLEADVTYVATIYRDAENAHYKNNPTAITINNIEVNKNTKLPIEMKEGGGFAISIVEKN